MKGCLKFILALITFCLAMVVAAGIYGLFWVDRHVYVDQAIPIQVPHLDAGREAKLVKLFPLRNLFAAESKTNTARVRLNEEESNWVANYILSRRGSTAKILLKLGDDRITAKYSQRISDRKYLNVMLDAGLAVKKENTRVNLERLQIGDRLVPATFLGQFNYLVELYIEKGFRISGDGIVKIGDLRIGDDKLEATLVKP
jgi:hypothetical protein